MVVHSNCYKYVQYIYIAIEYNVILYFFLSWPSTLCCCCCKIKFAREMNEIETSCTLHICAFGAFAYYFCCILCYKLCTGYMNGSIDGTHTRIPIYFFAINIIVRHQLHLVYFYSSIYSLGILSASYCSTWSIQMLHIIDPKKGDNVAERKKERILNAIEKGKKKPSTI